jgi:hypothetical protein
MRLSCSDCTSGRPSDTGGTDGRRNRRPPRRRANREPNSDLGPQRVPGRQHPAARALTQTRLHGKDAPRTPVPLRQVTPRALSPCRGASRSGSASRSQHALAGVSYFFRPESSHCRPPRAALTAALRRAPGASGNPARDLRSDPCRAHILFSLSIPPAGQCRPPPIEGLPLRERTSHIDELIARRLRATAPLPHSRNCDESGP